MHMCFILFRVAVGLEPNPALMMRDRAHPGQVASVSQDIKITTEEHIRQYIWTGGTVR